MPYKIRDLQFNYKKYFADGAILNSLEEVCEQLISYQENDCDMREERKLFSAGKIRECWEKLRNFEWGLEEVTALKKVKSIDHLRELAKQSGGVDVEVRLQGGLKSSKHISLTDDDTFEIVNFIDDSVIEVSKEDIFNENITLVGRAIEKGALLYE